MINKLKLFSLIFLPLLFATISFQGAHADVMDAVKQQDLYNCYQSGRFRGTVEVGLDGIGIDNIINADLDRYDVILPSHQYGHTINDDKLMCKQLIIGLSEGTQNWPALVPGAEKVSTTQGAAELLQKLGYVQVNDGASDNRQCVNFAYELSQSSAEGAQKQYDQRIQTKDICITNLQNGKVTSDSLIESPIGQHNQIKLWTNKAQGGRGIEICDAPIGNRQRKCNTVALNDSESIEDLSKRIHDAIDDRVPSFVIEERTPGNPVPKHIQYGLNKGFSNSATSINDGQGKGTWSFPNNGSDWNTAAKTALKNILGWTEQGGGVNIKVSDEDKSNLHKWYFTNFYGAHLYCNGDGEYEHASTSGSYIDLGDRKIDGKKCIVKYEAGKGEQKVHGISPSMTWYQDYNLQELINAMSDNDLKTAADVTDPEASSENPDGQNSNNTDACYNAGVESMAWLLCPTINNGAYAADGIMDVINTWLNIDPTKAFSPEAEAAWGVFRNIANMVLIIVFLVVIFSQITGYGIDNYGIKKILPRLIVLAVLVNLSFLICEILVDLSNALGVGLYDLFKNIATGIKGGTAPVDLGLVAGVGAVLAIGVGVGAVAVGALGITSVISALLAVGLALVALLMFFVMLGARMIAVIILAIVSPVAVVLYALPNTQNIFNKWWKIFETCLVIYPICGALYGASYIIGVIADSGSENLVWQLIKIIAPFLPFLALPALLKGAMGALGVVGGALATIGSGAKGLARTGSRAVQNTEGFKNMRQKDIERRTRRRAGLDETGQLTARGKKKAARAQTAWGRRLGLDRAQAANIAAANKSMAADRQATAALINAQSKAGIADAGSPEAYYTQKIEDAATQGDLNGVNAAWEAAVSSGYFRPGQLAKMARNTNDSLKFDNDAQRANWYRDFGARYGESFLKKDFELRSYAQNGGAAIGSDGHIVTRSLGNYGDFAKAQGITSNDLKPEDLEALSDESTAAMISAGAVTAGQANQLISNSKNLSAAQRVMYGAVSDNKATADTLNAASIVDGNTKIEQFVKDARSLAANPAFTRDGIGINATASEVQSWTKSAPQNVRIVK